GALPIGNRHCRREVEVLDIRHSVRRALGPGAGEAAPQCKGEDAPAPVIEGRHPSLTRQVADGMDVRPRQRKMLQSVTRGAELKHARRLVSVSRHECRAIAERANVRHHNAESAGPLANQLSVRPDVHEAEVPPVPRPYATCGALYLVIT